MWCEDTKELVIEVPRDGFHEWESTTDRVGGEFEFAVDMAENEVQTFLDLVEICGGEKFIQREIFHQLVIFVHQIRSIFEASVSHKANSGMEAFGIP